MNFSSQFRVQSFGLFGGFSGFYFYKIIMAKIIFSNVWNFIF